MCGSSTRGKRRVRIAVETLEGRAVPATFGVPWSDPSHLTLGFVPDGTPIAGHTSTLFKTLNAQQPTADWQRAILKAFQTWAVNANVNIGLVADGGQPFGAPGQSQGDPRFGDIRVGAQPMSADALSISVPNDPTVASTLTGDVLINTSDKFGGKALDVFAVLLHEAGHVFGFGESTDPKSPMYGKYLGNTQLTASDIGALQALYGTRAPDPHEGSGGNDTIGRATTIQPPGSYTGATPLVIYGDVTTNKDVDFYSFRPPSGYKGSVTVRLQSSGISLLTPHLTVVDARGRVLGDAQASSDFGDTVTVTLASVDPNATYYLKVQGATSDVFGIGGYGVAVTFNATSKVTPAAVDSVLRGPYQGLNPNDINALFLGTAHELFNDDHGSDDAPGSAAILVSRPGYARNSHYETVGSLVGTGDADFYRINTADSPRGGKPLVLTVNVRAMTVNGTTPRVTILDRSGNAVPAQVLSNGGGSFTVQATGMNGGWYLLKVGPNTAPGSPAGGNYALTASFGTTPANLSTFASGTLTAAAASKSYSLYAGESQLMHMVLSASAGAAPVAPGTAVQMTVLDASGNVIYTLTAAAGDTVSGPDLFLTPGAYTLRFTALYSPGAARPALTYLLAGESISDPIGPVPTDPTLTPVYTDPANPGSFLYPGGTPTKSSFLIVPNPGG